MMQLDTKKDGLFLHDALYGCLFCAIALLPFNGMHAMPKIFGEFSIEGSFYPLMIGMILWGLILLLNYRLPKLQHVSFKLLLFFLLWVLISTILNWSAVLNAYTKGRTGLEKFILQLILLVFAFLTSLLSYYVFAKLGTVKTLKLVKNAILVSFIIVSLYSVIEIPYLFGSVGAEKKLRCINSLFRSESIAFLCPGRLRSVCAEPSLFGSYFSFVYPWLLGCLFSTKKNFSLYLIVIGWALIMIYLTYSRTAYFITAAETFLFVVLIAKRKKYHKKTMLFCAFLPILGVVCHFISLEEKASGVIVSLFSKGTKHESSNIGRFGSSVAGLKMGYDHPIIGVGFGQYVFHMPEYVPSWAWESKEIRQWASTKVGTPFAHTFNLYARIFAELGIVGLILWLSIWGTVLISIHKIIRKLRYYNPQEEIFDIILTVSILGVMLLGFNMDSFRFMEYWILLPITWSWVEMNSVKSTDTVNLLK